MKLEIKKVFNENGSDAIIDRKILGGNSTGIMNLNSIKYKWTQPLIKLMLGNFWVPEVVSLVEDKVTIKELTQQELTAVKATLSFLIALDSMQVSNSAVLAEYVSAPEISALFTVQSFQELIHSQSYQYILNELFPNLQREEIYEQWRTNPLLLQRNKSIASLYEKFIQDKTLQNFKIALAADYVLESLYFYNGFNLFFQLASRNKLVGVSKVITYILADESTHVSFMVQLIKELFDKDDYKMLESVIRDAVEEEIQWGYATYSEDILGISKKSTESYIKYLANMRSKVLGLGVLYEGYSVNPYAYLTTKKKEGFFETTVTEYSTAASVGGWDDF